MTENGTNHAGATPHSSGWCGMCFALGTAVAALLMSVGLLVAS